MKKNFVHLDRWWRRRAGSYGSIQDYWNYKEEIMTCDVILYKEDRVIVPQSLRWEMFDCIHLSHFGIENCRRFF